MSEELKPCPLCKSTNIINSHDAAPVYCMGCGLRALDLDRWNTRPADQQAATIAELRTGIHSIVKELRSWQFKTRIAEPYQVPEYEDFVKIVHAIEIAAEK